MRKGHEPVHVVLLCPVPGWSEEEEAQLQQRGSLRGGVGGQRWLCTLNLSVLMSHIFDSTLIVRVGIDLHHLEEPYFCRLSNSTSSWSNDPALTSLPFCAFSSPPATQRDGEPANGDFLYGGEEDGRQRGKHVQHLPPKSLMPSRVRTQPVSGSCLLSETSSEDAQWLLLHRHQRNAVQVEPDFSVTLTMKMCGCLCLSHRLTGCFFPLLVSVVLGLLSPEDMESTFSEETSPSMPVCDSR